MKMRKGMWIQKYQIGKQCSVLNVQYIIREQTISCLRENLSTIWSKECCLVNFLFTHWKDLYIYFWIVHDGMKGKRKANLAHIFIGRNSCRFNYLYHVNWERPKKAWPEIPLKRQCLKILMCSVVIRFM